uniref:SMP-30/Gluconolactonase/LRE-like region domain-containing protein n=1 Tax=Branchiostoma floridae TaxID=7739 RepID=C3YZ76_BRAFL|eukprot:XP_002598135.1 hypothetical protein BRAFLDRAFT_82918 [Branchiostoma floridae]
MSLQRTRDPTPTYKPTTTTPNSDRQVEEETVRDPNPTYKPATQISNEGDHEDTRDPNPTYPLTAPKHQSDIHSEPATDSAGQDTRIQPRAVTHVQPGQPANNDGETLFQAIAGIRLTDNETASTTATDDGNPCHQPDAVTHLKAKHDGSACLSPNEASLRRADSDDNLFIQPYAVRYQEEDGDGMSTEDGTSNSTGNTPVVVVTDDNIEPYAVAFIGQGVAKFVQKRSGGLGSATPAKSGNDISTNLEGDDSPSANALNQNPMYVPNMEQQTTCGRFQRCMRVYHQICRRHAERAILLVVLLVCGIFAGLYFTRGVKNDHGPTPAVDTTLTRDVACCSSDDTAMADPMSMSTPAMDASFIPVHSAADTASIPDHITRYNTGGSTTVMSTSSTNGSLAQTTPTLPGTSQGTNGVHAESAKIVFGGEGTKPGRFLHNYGVAVSADNEIFVTDLYNSRVQVFDMNGIFLRLFPTVPPGEEGNRIQPCDAAIDGEGHVWVVGRTDEIEVSPLLHVVQYSKDGLALTKFDLQHWSRSPSIALDLHRNRIIVEALTNIFILHQNGSVLRRFGRAQRLKFSYVTTDQEGNILVTDTAHHSVHVYDPSGRWMFEFGGFGLGEGRFILPKGICVDRSGHILVANWGNNQIDMFTRRGEFVRTVVKITPSWGIAVGPDGQLVVTNIRHDTVTIFPRQLALN